MSGEGLPWAKVDSAFPQDPKVRRLERRLAHRDYLACVGAWMLVLADAWRTGSRTEGVSAEDLDLDQDLREALRSVGLIDDEGRIPARSWDKWGGATMEEVRTFRSLQAEKGRIGGRKRASEASRSEAGRFQPNPAPGLDRSSPDPARGLESSSPDPAKSKSKREKEREKVPRGGGPGEEMNDVRLTALQLAEWDSFDEETERRHGATRVWEPVKRAWLGRGLRHPPTEKQRAILWEILDARPLDLPRWIREAPKTARSGTEIIRHVLQEWHRVQEEITRKEERPVRTDPAMVSLREILARAGS